ncbi:hypothetical protein PRIPAC_72414 [Pristionchus pacificus]|uniref:Uncharacterized protein n=1 Tax=Pristionchus pacificus TaxID=54126 RepID=A0A2A6BUP3_PRIPA|nr:hypothetical protein PRIPAC_86474 [Pristionchus pacificus]KAF8383272.1 hypothetical protein PRIPAC_72414 [Pristionchus pacificus]|eukprot:PDM69578.1 hypothetical protein PRIPAC_44674 [Pristionchus pacificus]
MRRRSSSRSGTGPVRSATTRSRPCTTEAPRRPSSSTISPIRSQSLLLGEAQRARAKRLAM